MRLPDLLSTRFGRLSAFFLLYVTEGIPQGFTGTAIAAQMRRQGLGPGQIGAFIGALYLPWAWKWVMGPVVDVVYSRRLGRRRGWILAMQLLMVVGLMALMPINFVSELTLFTAVVLLINSFGATQDVAIDALATRVLGESERGVANGVMFAGAYIGIAAGGSGVLLLTRYVPFNSGFFLVAAGILAITLLVVLPLREPPSRMEELASGPRLNAVAVRIRTYVRETLRAFFGTRAAIAGLAFALLPAGSYALSLVIGMSLAVELGLNDQQIGTLTLLSTITSAVCCVIGGYLSDRFGRRRMLALYLACTALPTLALAVTMSRYGWILPRPPGSMAPGGLVQAFWAVSLVYAVFQGLMYGTRTALFMDICSPEVAATQFTAYMALLNFVIWYSSTWQGWSAQRFGYPATLAADCLLGLAGLAALPWMAPRRKTK